MDYVYGTVNQKAVNNSYYGGRTNTADVTITDNTIFVEAHADTEFVEELINEKIETLDYTDSAETDKFVTSVSEEDGIISVSRSNITESNLPSIHEDKVINLVSDLNTIRTNLNNEVNRAEAREDEIEAEIEPAVEAGIAEHNISEEAHEDIREELATHITDAVKHITSEERTYWNDKVNDVQVDDVSVVDEDGIAKIPPIKLTEAVTATQTIGGILKGTSFAIGTPIQSIVKQLLQGDYDVDVYFGFMEPSINPETGEPYLDIANMTEADIENLSKFTTSKQVLLKQGNEGGFHQDDVEPEGVYVVFAMAREYGLNCFKIRANNYPVERIKDPVGKYDIYHLENPTEEGNYRFDYSFEVK